MLSKAASSTIFFSLWYDLTRDWTPVCQIIQVTNIYFYSLFYRFLFLVPNFHRSDNNSWLTCLRLIIFFCSSWLVWHSSASLFLLIQMSLMAVWFVFLSLLFYTVTSMFISLVKYNHKLFSLSGTLHWRYSSGWPLGKRFLNYPSVSGGLPPGFYLLQEGWVYRPAPEAPQKGECRRGRGHFWKLPDACGLRPCTRTHYKKALCHTCPFSEASNKYHWRHSSDRN